MWDLIVSVPDHYLSFYFDIPYGLTAEDFRSGRYFHYSSSCGFTRF